MVTGVCNYQHPRWWMLSAESGESRKIEPETQGKGTITRCCCVPGTGWVLGITESANNLRGVGYWVVSLRTRGGQELQRGEFTPPKMHSF